MGVRPSFPSCPVLLIPDEGPATLGSDEGAFGIGGRDVSGTAPCNAPLCGPLVTRDVGGVGAREEDGTAVVTAWRRENALDDGSTLVEVVCGGEVCWLRFGDLE